jgi:hypothetical protein
VIIALVAASGCAAESWTPPPPAGVTWRYDHLGFQDRSSTVVTGSMRGPAAALVYGGAFSFRDEIGTTARMAADPFAESAPIDGVRFNGHLAGQGARLAPAGSGTIAPAVAPAASASSPTAAPRGEP